MSIKSNVLPLCIASSVVSDQKLIFHTFDKKITVEAPFELMQKLIEFCDGTRTCDEVLSVIEKGWDPESVRELICELINEGVLVDAHDLSNEIWKVVKNPMLFPKKVTEIEVSDLVDKARERHRSSVFNCNHSYKKDSFTRILEERRSVRSFSGEEVSLQNIVNMLWSAYGEFESKQDNNFHRTAPSAGALFPLIIHLTLFKKTSDLCSGVYRVRYDEFGGVGFELTSKDYHRFARAFLNPAGILNGIHGVITISGSFSITGEKYGDRSMLYVPLEAGHVAQNVLLEATNCGLATLEIGGFLDELLSKAVHLSNEYKPMTAIAFGYESKGTTIEDPNSELEIEWAVPMSGSYHPAFCIASVRVSKKRSWSHGRDSSPELAIAKAISEAREWASCGSIPDLIFDSYSNLKSVIDPRSIIEFRPEQYCLKDFPFAPFDEKLIYGWTKGYDIKTGSEVYILADHVYFPYFPETPYYAYANSSGCAAHPDKQTAIEKATLELIERDSFMNAYLNELSLPSVEEKTLPHLVQERIAEIRKQGFEIWVKDHSLDLAPVVFVFAQNEDLNFTTCASCSSFNTEYAVGQALMEVEASVLSRLQNGAPKPIKPEEVVMPLDHGRLYGQKQYFRNADFMVNGGGEISFQEIGKSGVFSWQELLDLFVSKNLQLILVPLILSDEYGGNNDLHIVRSIVPELVPMTFGYQQEPLGMKRLCEISEKFGNRKFSFLKFAQFPHPFE